MAGPLAGSLEVFGEGSPEEFGEEGPEREEGAEVEGEVGRGSLPKGLPALVPCFRNTRWVALLLSSFS